MKIFFDFDDTLFNTQAFAQGIARIFVRFGVTDEEFWSSYRQIRGTYSGKGWCYSFDEHIKKLQLRLLDNERGLRVQLREYMIDLSQFVFSDVRSALRVLKEHNCQLIVLSFGDEKFQRAKVAGSGLGSFLDDIWITQEDKGQLLVRNGILSHEEAFLFDDKVVHIEDVKRLFPSIRSVLVHRNHKEHADSANDQCDLLVSDFTGIEKIVFG